MPNFDHQYDREITRRSIFLGAGASLLCAPVIVPITSLMRVRGLILPIERPHEGFVRRLMFYQLYRDLQSGRMTTNINGRIPPELEARRIVVCAFSRGFLPASADPTILNSPKRLMAQSSTNERHQYGTR
jgi:hypothetical protein